MTLLCAAAAHAEGVTYTYSGLPYDDVNGSYTTAMTITGYVTFANALPDNLPLFYYFPIDWSFSDGVQTLSEAGGDDLTNYQFATDATGDIIGWSVVVDTPDLTTGHIQECSTSVGCTQQAAWLGSSYAFLDGSQGSWTVSAAAPEPSSILLFVVGLAALATSRRAKRTRKRL